MSISGLVATSRTPTNAAENRERAITLLDTTAPHTETEVSQADSISPTSGTGPLSRRWTKGTLREELVRRKYAKWQEHTSKNSEEPTSSSDENCNSTGERNDKGKGRTGRLRDKIPFKSRKPSVKVDEKEESAVDVLYENQRGSFLCGIPLYSANSLLNFDPASWQTSAFVDSGVNITNAQLPDPSWGWAWRSWYVDMSRDVDEEGWEYSFSFKEGFSWHGSHPWFHSFVRRRRWLRKRVKIHSSKNHGQKGGVKDAHMLNADYFTIHAKKDISRESSADRNINRPSSYVSAGNYAMRSDSEDDVGEINDILALMTVLRNSRVDREKFSAVQNFIEYGGDELYYLADRMADVMAVLIYQDSRQRLQFYLKRVLDETIGSQDHPENNIEPAGEASKRKIDNLRRAVDAASTHMTGQEYWSDSKVKTTNSHTNDTTKNQELDTTPESADATGNGPYEMEDKEGTDIEDHIKGIPDSAEISEEPGIRWDTSQDEVHSPTVSTKSKGKEKA